MASLIENAISSNVKDDCESTATEEISMALDVSYSIPGRN